MNNNTMRKAITIIALTAALTAAAQEPQQQNEEAVIITAEQLAQLTAEDIQELMEAFESEDYSIAFEEDSTECGIKFLPNKNKRWPLPLKRKDNDNGKDKN